MGDIKVVCLGAGQDVGRSCIVVSMGGKNIMLDCGMHMGYNDDRRFPNFSLISKAGKFSEVIDLVCISHFHLDHVGALPHFTEVAGGGAGYSGPIVMTLPTKAIAPILLEDYRRITLERNKHEKKEKFFTADNIASCMKKVTAVNLRQVLTISDGFTVEAYYAGHVIGAAMFLIRVQNQSFLYTGDYNMTADRHLGAALISHNLNPDILITESTYGTTIRDSKRNRESDFLKRVIDTIRGGGNVLIPVFALGRAQELMILIDSYWTRMKLKDVPIYFTAGMAARANEYYKLFLNWTNETIKTKAGAVDAGSDGGGAVNPFEFANILPFDRSYLKWPEKKFKLTAISASAAAASSTSGAAAAAAAAPAAAPAATPAAATPSPSAAVSSQPVVIFATPGMLHAGLSLEIFKLWARDPKNLIVIPGYCVAGTVGHSLLSGFKKIKIDNDEPIQVNCGIANLSFSAHADSNGILQLIRQTAPKNVILVHGEKQTMRALKERVIAECKIPCFDPPNHVPLTIHATGATPIQVSSSVVSEARREYFAQFATKANAVAASNKRLADSAVDPSPVSDSNKRMKTELNRSTAAATDDSDLKSQSAAAVAGTECSEADALHHHHHSDWFDDACDSHFVLQPAAHRPIKTLPLSGIILDAVSANSESGIQLMTIQEAIYEAGMCRHDLKFVQKQELRFSLPPHSPTAASAGGGVLDRVTKRLTAALKTRIADEAFHKTASPFRVAARSVGISLSIANSTASTAIAAPPTLVVSLEWTHSDEVLAARIRSVIQFIFRRPASSDGSNSGDDDSDANFVEYYQI